MRTFLALFTFAGLATACFAGEIKTSAIMQVKPNSIWFQAAPKLAHWQKLKQSGDAKALAAYQAKALAAREAWQFTGPLTVKILSYDPKKKRVEVEMTTEGRLQGSTWSIDPDALAP